MTDYPERAVENVREKCERREDVSAADADAILDASDEIFLLGESEYSIQRHDFFLKRWYRMASQVGGLADALDDRDAAEDIVRWIHRTYDNPETNKDYRVALRMFGELATDGEGKPESIAWIPGGYPKNYDPAPDPAEMFRWERHVVPMLEACMNSRDRAMIALAFDAGPRPGELYDLTVGSFADHEYGMKVTFESGKRGTRSPLLIPSVGHVQDWLDDHPNGDDPDAPLWSKLKAGGGISNNRCRDIFKDAADRADIKLPSTPTPARFRKSSASHLASQGVSQAHLEDHHGWDRGSDVAGRYIAVFGDANDREIARAHGVEVNERDDKPNAPTECPRCGRLVPAGQDTCGRCGQVFDHDTADMLDSIVDMIDDELLDAEKREVRERLVNARQGIDHNPDEMDLAGLHDVLASSSSSSGG